MAATTASVVRETSGNNGNNGGNGGNPDGGNNTPEGN